MVTIAFISDLHVDSSPAHKALVDHLCRALKELEPHAFILAGDVAGGAAELLETLEAFRGLSIPKLFVPGNHDLWIETRGALARYRLDSATKYHSLLPALCESSGWHYLPMEPFRINGVGICGAMGWYDYSLRNPSLDRLIPKEAYRRGCLGRLVWKDSLRIRWPRRPGVRGWRRRSACLSDEDILEAQLEALEDQLSRLESEGLDAIFAVTHFLPGLEQVAFSGNPELDFPWGFAGSTKIGRLLASRPSVRGIICGHIHRPARQTSGSLPLYRSPVGSLGRLLTPHPGPSELACLARQKIGLIEIQ